jgi:2-polyprenyl-6-methoxyphenol hydroxylase-like FAD-dependent oxidoreductase
MYRVAVIGTGIVGSAVALLLKKKDILLPVYILKPAFLPEHWQ